MIDPEPGAPIPLVNPYYLSLSTGLESLDKKV